ncbi:MAG: hypothetical protein ABIG89_01555 [Candidatus Woesearchaeota archaeon]
MFSITFDFNQIYPILKSLVLFVLGMAIYSIFIFKFYRFVARKDIFKLNLAKYNTVEHEILKKTVSVIFYLFEYVFLFPIFTFFWFAILTVLLTFLAKGSGIENVLLVSVAVVGAIRMTAYYNEDLSRDLAKMLPFALLGVFLVDISFFSLSTSIESLNNIPQHVSLIVYYLLFVIMLEFILRILHGIFRLFVPEEEEE